ncbi:hypothetical protein Kosp01_20320 [Kocuria sp. NBRC 114282]|uniref:FAD-binding protein n=1 Tax=Kocuria sp. NBRC 114282 TaxID=2994520 RepID=UPI0024A19BC1|nr:hypothetical protein Kosp01_20320 [Kocuria sp. NBRC 114282]
MLEPDAARRGAPSSRSPVGSFELRAQAVVIAIGGNHEQVRKWWPSRLGTPPQKMITGVPEYVDGRMRDIATDQGVRLVNRDRMWHYREGLQNWDPVWPDHAIRILPGPSSVWLDARAPAARPGPVQDFMAHGDEFVIADTLPELVDGMNALTGDDLLELTEVEDIPRARDHEMTNPYSKDAQAMGIRSSRRYLGDKITRIAKPHRILDPAHGPLIAVRRWIVTRKTLGGIQTDLAGRAMRADGQPIPGLYAAGEAAGFGGGGAHGYNALEGTFLGGCLFTDRTVGRSLAKAL